MYSFQQGSQGLVFEKRARGVFIMTDPRGGPGRGQGRKKKESGKAYNYKPSLEAYSILSASSIQKKTLIDRAIVFYAQNHEILD